MFFVSIGEKIHQSHPIILLGFIVFRPSVCVVVCLNLGVPNVSQMYPVIRTENDESMTYQWILPEIVDVVDIHK